MEVRQIVLTPEKAAKYIAAVTAHAELVGRKDPNPRGSTRQDRIDNYAAQISAGLWEDGSTIALNEEGLLVEGFARCSAVVQTGIAINVVLISGVSARFEDVVDTGDKRTLAERLHARGEINCTHLASAINLILRCEINGTAHRHGLKIQNNVALDWFDKHQTLRDTVSHSLAICRGNPDLHPAPMSALLWGASKAAEEKEVTYFADQLQYGEDLHKGDPALALRRWVSSARNGEVGKSRLDQTYEFAIYIKAWNDYISGTERNILKFSPGGSRPEPYPWIQDENGVVCWPQQNKKKSRRR